MTLHQWNGSDYDEFDFTSGITPYVARPNKFVVGVTSLSSGRIFIQCFTYSNNSNRNASIIEMKFTGTTYTDVNDWTFTLIAGNNGSGYGDTDGILGVNTLSKLSSQAPNMYKGGTLNGEPVFYFFNVWGSAWGNPYGSNRFYIRKLFWNGSAWEVTTELTSTDDMRSFATNSSSDKFYFSNQTLDKIQYYDLNTSGSTSIIDSLNSSTEQERVPKTIDLINGVGFNDKSWSFDGVNDYIKIGDFFDMGTDSMTIDCWINVNQTLTQPGQIYTKAIADDVPYRYFFNVQTTSPRTGKIRAGFQGNHAGALVADGTTDLRGLGWVNVTIVWERTSTLRVYVNSELEGSIDISSKASDNLQSSFESFIGMVPDSGGITPSLFFSGDISNLKIYRDALSDQEIKQNYNATKWRFK